MSPLVWEAFVDELEKIAVSPAWISSKLTGMANKLPSQTFQARNAVSARLSDTGDRAKDLSRKLFHRAESKMPRSIMSRPTSPKSIASIAEANRIGDKREAYLEGRKAIGSATR